MERAFDIDIPDEGKRIYGTYREVGSDAPLVVFVHGFTGHRNEHIFFNGARALERAGISSYRFDLYCDALDARQLLDCTIDQHGADLDLVVGTLKREQAQRSITVVGHSLGALTALSSVERAFDNVVLWDPSANGDHLFRDWPEASWMPEHGAWLVRWGADLLVSDAMAKSWQGHETERLLADLGKPVKIVAAGASTRLEGCRRYAEVACDPKELAIVEGADHCFDVDGTEEALFVETIAWVNEHGRSRVAAP